MVASRNRLMVIYLAALIALGPFSIDLYLAALPTIKQYFVTTTSQTQLTLSLFFLGFALAQLFWGPLSDRLGRKPTVFIGLAVYLLSTAACYWAPNISTLMVGRLFQGAGGTCGIVMVMAMVKDLYSDHESTKVFALVFGVMAVAPIIAPMIGSHLLTWFGWRSCFAFLFAYGVLLAFLTTMLSEPFPRAKRRPLPVKRIAVEYVVQLSYLPFLMIVLSTACVFSAMFAFIASSPYMYIDMVGLSAEWFGYCFGIAAAFIILGNMALSWLKATTTDMQIIAIGVGVMFAGSALLTTLQVVAPHHLLSVLLPGVLLMFSVGILLPQLLSIAMRHVLHHNGITSALIGTIRFTAGGIVAFFAAHWVNTKAVRVGIAALILMAIMVVLLQCYRRWHHNHDAN